MRKLGILMLIVVMFNFIFSSYSFATPEPPTGDQTTTTPSTGDPSTEEPSTDAPATTTPTDNEDDDGKKGVFSYENYKVFSEEGYTTITTSTGDRTMKASPNNRDVMLSAAMGGLACIVVPYCAATSEWLLSQLAISGGLYHTESEYSAANTGMFSICSLVFGEFLLFNGKIYETNESLNPEVERETVAVQIDDIKAKAAYWFSVLKTVALGITLPMMVYALIKIFMATTGEESAGWKKILGSWLLALVFIFFSKYIIIALNTLNDKILDMLWSIRTSLEENNYVNFEVSFFETMYIEFKRLSGFQAWLYGMLYFLFIFAQISIFVKYIMRAFSLIFLAVTSPIFGILHAYNVMKGDEKSTISSWLKKYVTFLFIQPIHALLYIIFMFTASELAINAPLLGITFLWALSRAEKVAKIMLNMQGGFSLFRKG